MQTDTRGAAAGAAAGQGNSQTICSRLQRAFQARPAFRPLLRLTGRSQDGGAATTGGAPAATYGGAPNPIVLPAHAPAPSHVGKAPKPTAPSVTPGGAPPRIVHAPVVTLPAVPVKPAAANGGDKPAGKVPASAPSSVSATANKVAEKVAGWMPTPAKGGEKPAGKVPATSTPTTVSATANNLAEKVAGWMPVPAPPAGRQSADTKAEDKAQQSKGKVRVSSRVRKALASSK